MRPASQLVAILSTMPIALVTWLITFAPAQADKSWTQMHASDFPAYLEAMTFSNGNVLDATNSVCWGNWCVSFGDEPPVIRWIQISGDVGPGDMSLDIGFEKGLVCENPIEGRKSCWMWFQVAYGQHYCSVEGDTKFTVKCPQRLRLK